MARRGGAVSGVGVGGVSDRCWGTCGSLTVSVPFSVFLAPSHSCRLCLSPAHLPLALPTLPTPLGSLPPWDGRSAGQRSGGDWLLPLAAACGGLRVAAIRGHCGREREECRGASRAVGQSRAQVRGGPLPIPARALKGGHCRRGGERNGAQRPRRDRPPSVGTAGRRHTGDAGRGRWLTVLCLPLKVWV